MRSKYINFFIKYINFSILVSDNPEPEGKENRCRLNNLPDSSGVDLSCSRMTIRKSSDFIKYGNLVVEDPRGALTLVGASSVTKLDLSENLLSSQKLTSVLRNFPSLREIDVSGNRLRKVQKSLFNNNIHLETIVMRNNPRLKKVSKSIRQLPHLMFADFTGNPKLPDCFRESFDDVPSNEDFKHCV